MIIHGKLCGLVRVPSGWRFCPFCGAPVDGSQVILKAGTLVLESESFPVIITAECSSGKRVAFRSRGDTARVDAIDSDRNLVETLWRGFYDGHLDEDPLVRFPEWIQRASGLLVVVA